MPARSKGRPSPTTALVVYLDDGSNWKMDKVINTPIISCQKRLRKARNSVKRSVSNNDVLEFVGDRVNNLACSLMVNKVKISSEHHKVSHFLTSALMSFRRHSSDSQAVGRVLCNNDTLGRIAYQTILHAEAIFGFHDKKRVKDWRPEDDVVPPKALADIFEAYVGAVYEEHGWDIVYGWLQTLYQPLIKIATEDFLAKTLLPIPDNGSKSIDDMPRELVVYQARVWDYLYFKRSFLTEHGVISVDALPPSTQFLFSPSGELVNDSDRAEVAINLINFWICKIFMRVFPHLLEATYKGSHLVTVRVYVFIRNVTLLIHPFSGSPTWSQATRLLDI